MYESCLSPLWLPPPLLLLLLLLWCNALNNKLQIPLQNLLGLRGFELESVEGAVSLPLCCQHGAGIHSSSTFEQYI
jgi:hypothetical protein